jgi:hypothetical protein
MLRYDDAGNGISRFHQPWCKKSRAKKSYVKEALQPARDVLLSGPFKKFQTKFRAKFPAHLDLGFLLSNRPD